uniref:Eukaryotic translation initiation factor 3, subunit E, a n=1 Tax=Electrophorus electricus TaxID=8005 RepID=A0A4W4GC95_ELEEL
GPADHRRLFFPLCSRDGRMLFDYLAEKHGFRQKYLDSLSKYEYECGNYSEAVPATDRNALNSLWGKLASEILMQNWESATEDLTRLRETIDNNTVSSPLQSLQERTWLIHWSLCVFYNQPKGNLPLKCVSCVPRYLDAILAMCPHILPYLTTAVITNKDVRKCRQVLKDLLRVIQQSLLEMSHVNFYFDGAQKKLRECESVLLNDFSLVVCLEDFIENVHLFIFETFCRIHKCISISMLADKLNMTPEVPASYLWQGHVVMGNNAMSPYQQVMEKTKSLLFCSQMLAMNTEKKLSYSTRNKAPNWAAVFFLLVFSIPNLPLTMSSPSS